MQRKFALLMMIALLTVCAAFNAPIALQQAGVNWIVNGGMQDANADNLPDDWLMLDKQAGDGVTCIGFTRATCVYQFANVLREHRGIRQFVTPDLTGITQVTFSFRGQGFLTDAGAQGVVYLYTGGVFPIRSHSIQLPIGAAFNQVFSVTFTLPANTTGFHVDATAARAGSWSITDVRLEAAVVRSKRRG